MRIFQEEIFGPVLAVTTFGMKPKRSKSPTTRFTVQVQVSGAVMATSPTAWVGRFRRVVGTNCYHAYPAHAAFGGYKESGIGRETHKVML